MNRLASILPPAHVLVQVEASSKKRAFEEAGLLFENLHGLSRALVTDSLFSRERDTRLREKMLACADAQALHALIAQWESVPVS